MGRAILPVHSIMSKNSKSDHPLAGTRILIGRAKHQAGALSGLLRQLGATVLEIPFIEIRKPRSFQPLDSALKNLSSYDWLILTSANGVEATWDRLNHLHLPAVGENREGLNRGKGNIRQLPQLWKSGASAPRKGAHLTGALAPAPRIAAIGPATKKAIEKRGLKVHIVPKEYVAESVVRSLKNKVKGKRVLLVRAKVARDVIPRELRKAGAKVDVVEAYETVVPESSRQRLQAALANPRRRPHVVTFTSSSTVKNFVDLLGARHNEAVLHDVKMASIGPVTSSTLRELGLKVDIAAKEFTIPGLVAAIVRAQRR